MLKFSAYSGRWILVILLLITDVETRKEISKKESVTLKKTLMDSEGSVLMNDAEILDSLETRIRVKRNNSNSNSKSSPCPSHLVDSFTRDSYGGDGSLKNDRDACSFGASDSGSGSEKTSSNSSISVNLLYSPVEDVKLRVRKLPEDATPAVRLIRTKRNNYSVFNSATHTAQSRNGELLSPFFEIKSTRDRRRLPLAKLNRSKKNSKSKKENQNEITKKVSSKTAKRLIDPSLSERDVTEKRNKDSTRAEKKELLKNAVNISKGQRGLAEKKRQEKSQVEGNKLRTKRNQLTGTKHHFLNKADELSFYEKIREPDPAFDSCVDRDNSNLDRDRNGVRAVRSIEQVKELAKKLVAKVNELQTFLNGDAKRSEREETKSDISEIDDLCSNVSSTCAAFKETPKIVQRCISSSNEFEEFPSTSRNENSEPRKQRTIEKSGSVSEKRLASRKIRERTFNSSSAARRRDLNVKKKEKKKKKKRQAKWDRWTDWSSCSVTCGKGRQIRWRYCLQNCNSADTEMEEKACQLPACRPGKFLGIF